MIQSIEARLAEQGLSLPEPAAPVATYAPAVLHGGLLHISGQLPFLDGELMTGRVGEDRAIDYAQEAAKRCALMLLAQRWTATCRVSSASSNSASSSIQRRVSRIRQRSRTAHRSL
jgi:enamine deaminase RidA (YjgF/YER057c/UK114 family)